MKALLLAPHNDDETLFATFTLLRYRPHVIVCLRSRVQHDRGTGITHQQREQETAKAMKLLGCSWEQWPHSDAADLETLEHDLQAPMRHLRLHYQRVFAPAVEPGGHDQHNLVGRVALNTFGHRRVTRYLTYRRGHKRSRSDHEAVFKPDWPALKLQALACYRSQIKEPTTLPWFIDDTLREWYAHRPAS